MPNELVTSRLFGNIPTANASQWQVMHDGNEYGPMTEDAVIEMAEAGKIDRDDLVKESGGQWIKACDAAILRRQFLSINTSEQAPFSLEHAWAKLAPYHSYAPAALLVVAVLVGVGIALVSKIAPSRELAGSTWQGSENLEKFGYLAFDFRPKGVVIMTDAMRHTKGAVQGTWSQSGNDVRIKFTNCQYRGVIQGDAITGTASFDQFGPTWAFSVSRR